MSVNGEDPSNESHLGEGQNTSDNSSSSEEAEKSSLSQEEAGAELSEAEPADAPVEENLSPSEEAPDAIRSYTDKIALDGQTNDQLRWYVLHTYSGFEDKVRKALEFRAREKGLEHKVGSLHIPQTHQESTTKTGKKRVTSRASFPGYVMAQLELDDATKHLVKDTPKVTGFVGDNINPRPLPDHEVRTMLALEPEEGAQEEVVVAEVKFAKGDPVKVIDGPFASFDGVIDEVRPEKQKVRVLVSIFGRETPVELEYKQVEQV